MIYVGNSICCVYERILLHRHMCMQTQLIYHTSLRLFKCVIIYPLIMYNVYFDKRKLV